VISADLQALFATFNTQLGSQATPLAIAATATTSTATGTPSPGPVGSHGLLSGIHSTGPTIPPVNQSHATRLASRKRR
jgi:hypothetical protein